VSLLLVPASATGVRVIGPLLQETWNVGRKPAVVTASVACTARTHHPSQETETRLLAATIRRNQVSDVVRDALRLAGFVVPVAWLVALRVPTWGWTELAWDSVLTSDMVHSGDL
jgi:hypothetical protein